jgi:hypothetical protein
VSSTRPGLIFTWQIWPFPGSSVSPLDAHVLKEDRPSHWAKSPWGAWPPLGGTNPAPVWETVLVVTVLFDNHFFVHFFKSTRAVLKY